jgi:putative membrane protein
VKKEMTGIVILIILYGVGLSGILLPAFRPLVLPLSAYNLLISFLILLHSYRWKKEMLFASFLVFLIGFFVEWVGVHTSLLFGTYWYGANLGPKFLEVPFIIGINWAMLTLVSSAVGKTLTKSMLLNVVLGASLMTGMDWLMEPVAIKSDFWHWKNETIPVYNFICWFVVSLLTNWIFVKIAKPTLNKTAITLFILLTLFFTIQQVV